jgi:8-oxo-dGTP pyrophosphatase MutT (NUDIX family)
MPKSWGLTLLKDGVRDKAAALEEILEETGTTAAATAFVETIYLTCPSCAGWVSPLPWAMPTIW